MFALTRGVPASFADALCAAPSVVPISVALARQQHAAYRAALAELGVVVTEVAVADELPDSCFVEDTAVVAAGVALVTRPGAVSRQPETAAIFDALAGQLEVARMEAPATLDGGDCMRVGSTIYVGRSARTNAAGIARLAEVFEPRGLRVVPIAMPEGVLHLKCVCAPLGDDRITLAAGTIPRDAFGDVHVVTIPADECYGANAVAIGATVLVADGFPRTHDVLTAAGFCVVPLATTEFRKADGALTCLSIVLPRP
ncbi:MAG: dimethylargininase [Deltaproteobacteria bacterium]|nr:dimethylargininase [Deltaproteobacteria bacterium]MDQ3298311.1 arginine deiminase family protein [Myxococcota bacterium]